MNSVKRIFFRFLLNIYPPYLGTGIWVKYIAPDFREVLVQMKMHWYNRNYVKTHFGGSLYAMTDPFYMLMLIQILGREYIVWDKAARIDFIKPGTGKLTAHFQLHEQQIREVLSRTQNGEKFLPEYEIQIKNSDGDVIARVIKTLHIRHKK